MKYIRTKDRIREIIEDFGSSCNVKSTYSKGRPSIDNFTVVSGVRFAPRADSIKKLCDELVLKDLETEMCFVMSAVHIQDIKDNWKNLMDNDYFKNHTIYGAIWTDKGLIYAAKMNDKGELELL